MAFRDEDRAVLRNGKAEPFGVFEHFELVELVYGVVPIEVVGVAVIRREQPDAVVVAQGLLADSQDTGRFFYRVLRLVVADSALIDSLRSKAPAANVMTTSALLSMLALTGPRICVASI